MQPPTSPLRLSWDGTADDGRRAPDGQYRLRVALRDEGRSAIVQKTMNVDTQRAALRRSASASAAAIRRKRMGNIISQGDREVRIYIQGVSRFRDAVPRLCRTDQGKPREVTQLPSSGRARTALELGRAASTASRSTPGTYLVQARGARHGGQRGRHARRVRGRRRSRGRPGLTVRGLAAQPPLRPGDRGPAGRVPRRRARRRRTAGACAGWGTRRCASAARRPDRVLAFRAPDGRRRASTCSSCAPAAGTRRCRSSCRPSERSQRARGRPDDQLARHRQGRRPAVRRPAEHARRRRHGALAARVRRRRTGCRPGSPTTSRRCSSSSTAAGSATTSPATSTSTSRATRAPRTARACCSPARSAGSRARSARRLRRYVTDGGRVAVFGADTLRRGVRLRVHDVRGRRDAVARHAAGRRRPVRRARRAGCARCRRPPRSISQFEGASEYGLMEGALDLPGFTRLEESTSLGERQALLAAVGQPLTPEEEAEAAQLRQARARAPPGADARCSSARARSSASGCRSGRSGSTTPNVAQVTRNIVDILRGVRAADPVRRDERHRRLPGLGAASPAWSSRRRSPRAPCSAARCAGARGRCSARSC